MTAKRIVDILSTHRFIYNDELELQSRIEVIFQNMDIPYKRGCKLDTRENLIDFLIDPKIGMEVKIKGDKRAIFRQVERYCETGMLHAMILVTARAMKMPRMINGVPITILNINRAMLP